MEKSNWNSKSNLVITCSGAADVGYITDRVGRMLKSKNHCNMSCMALFASCSEEKIKSLKSNNIIVIDGCNEECGKKVMEERGIEEYSWLLLSNLGYEKGETPTTQSTIDHTFNEALKLLL